MAPEPEILRDRGRSLEEQFFLKEDQRLLQRLRDLQAAEHTREALAKAAGVSKREILDRLLAAGLRPETIAALGLVPLVEVAWADGKLDARERSAVLERARTLGLVPGTTAHDLLEAWLNRRPDPGLLDAWTQMIRGIRDELGPAEADRLKDGLLEQARAVASASGGVLGLGSRVSGAEAAMLARLEAAFSPGP
jgi:hypothetical protein